MCNIHINVSGQDSASDWLRSAADYYLYWDWQEDLVSSEYPVLFLYLHLSAA